MRKGWEIKRLGDILEVQNGYAFNSKLFTKSKGTPLIRIRDIKNGYTTETNYLGSYDKKYEVQAGDYLIGMDGEFRCHEWKGDKAILNQRVCRLQKFNKDLFPRFLFYGINKHLKKIEKVTAYVTVKHISSRQIENITLAIPSLFEQKRIVSILDQAFTAIDKAKANLEKNLQNAKELFESYLHKAFTKERDTFEEKKLSAIAVAFGRGKSKHRPRNDKKLYGGKYPFIQTGDIRNANKHISSFTQTYNETGLAQSKLWPKRTICITIAANIAETGILDFDSCFPDSVIGLVPDPLKADVDYTYYLLQYFKAELQKLGKGSAQANINLATFENQYFPFPSLKKQNEIVKLLDKIYIETTKLSTYYQRKISTIEDLKKSILQKAFNGELTADEITAHKADSTSSSAAPKPPVPHRRLAKRGLVTR